MSAWTSKCGPKCGCNTETSMDEVKVEPTIEEREHGLFIRGQAFDGASIKWLPREWLPALAMHPALIAEVVKNAIELDVDIDYDPTYDIGLDATPRNADFIPAGRYALIPLPEEAP